MDMKGCGEGKGGGSGGNIQNAGQGIGIRGSAMEEEYFKKVEIQQLRDLKEKIIKDEKRLTLFKSNYLEPPFDISGLIKGGLKFHFLVNV
ncbi:hypothetical protein GJ496_002724 [Pomphorhynchus laevis]|nr:hypothetical protein GJ496_002724 [Pomphorhynchus laevis]